MARFINLDGREYHFGDCYRCGVLFAYPKTIDDAMHENKKQAVYCPNGHAGVYAESESDKMRRERDRAIQEQARLSEQATRLEASLRATEARLARTTKRAHAGVCQCCNRSFANVARHMKTKHPNVTPLKARA